MKQYSLLELNKLSKDLNYNRDSLEKVLRLIEILKLFNEHNQLKGRFVLKGGTAINLCLFDFPRLSADIDLDFNENFSKDELSEVRKFHQKIINENVSLNGYQVHSKSRFSYSLDSYLLQYTNAIGSIDYIKVEINYSNRIHILLPIKYQVKSKISENISILGLDKIELYGSKIAALISRTTARDLFDVFEMINHSVIKEEEYDMLRKNVIFYVLLANNFESLEHLLEQFKTNIEGIDFKNIRRNLIPMLKVGTKIDIDVLKKTVADYINELIITTTSERRYIELYNSGTYEPALLFVQHDIANRIINHPMIMWKMSNYNK